MVSNLQPGIDKIKQWEKCVLRAYKPLPNDKWTIGYGQTQGITEGMVWTQRNAEVDLSTSIQSYVKVLSAALRSDTNYNEFGAFLSLAWNCGAENVAASTAVKLHNAKAPLADIEKAFKSWKKSGGKVVAGLVNRRKDEWDTLYVVPPSA